MARKEGDKAYASYLHYQAFSSDMPVHRINQTNWYLKFEDNLPAFFIKADDVFRQMPPMAFFATAERSTLYDFTGWKEQTEKYFNLTIEEIKCQTDKEHLRNLPLMPPLETTSSTLEKYMATPKQELEEPLERLSNKFKNMKKARTELVH